MLKSKNFILVKILFFLFIVQSLFAQTSQWRIIWDRNNEDDMAAYLVFKGEQPNPSNQIATVNHPVTEYTDTNLEKGILYYYRLKARDTANNDSEFSDQDSAAIPRIDFSGIQNQVLAPEQSFQFDLDEYVHDPDHANNQLEWKIPEVSILDINYDPANNLVTVTAPTEWTSQEALPFEVMDPDSFFDVVNMNFYSDSSSVPNEPGLKINAYPIPYRPDQHAGTGGIIFSNLPINSTLIIYNFLGEPVFKASAISNRFIWDVRNDSSKEVNSGLYIYHIKSKSKTATGKLVIIR